MTGRLRGLQGRDSPLQMSSNGDGGTGARIASASGMSLDTDWRKRPFGHAALPGGKQQVKQGFAFVIQKHAASHLHYDFRLELDGVLLSWAVPKGPTLNTGEKRLAMRTEDHPLEYASFEGTIPRGEHGGGTVIVWDRGLWRPEGEPREGLSRGRLTFSLEGEKLRGRWRLVRTQRGDVRSGTSRERWLLMKSDDAASRSGDEIVDTEPVSVKTGRTIEEVAQPTEATPKAVRRWRIFNRR